jgi:hypothetical protein
LCCVVVQAHLEAQWEEATLRATRVMNALEFIAEAPVRRCDVRDMLDKRARSATGGQQVCYYVQQTCIHSLSKVSACTLCTWLYVLSSTDRQYLDSGLLVVAK